MHVKHISNLGLVLLLSGLCSVRAVSDEQRSFQLVSWKDPKAVRKALKKAHIIPDTLNDFVPSCHLHIVYTSSREVVDLGNRIKPSRTKEAPAVQISCSNARVDGDPRGFVVALTDPDAPSRKDPKWSEMCHWIATLSDGGSSLEARWEESLQGAKEIVEYKPPGPPSKTGYHRYIFVLLEGDTKNLTAPPEREHWGAGKQRHGVRDWAKKEGLEVAGANFFFARNEN